MPDVDFFRRKCEQAVEEKWPRDLWLDFWVTKLFDFVPPGQGHGSDYWKSAHSFMNLLWDSPDDAFLSSWPYWELHHPPV
jgi:hypothetical protein